MDKTPENESEDPTPPDGETDAAAPAVDTPYGGPAPVEPPVPPAAETAPPVPPVTPPEPEPPYAAWAPPTLPGPGSPTPGYAGYGAVPPPDAPPERGPGVGAGIGIGFVLQLAGVVLFLLTLFVIPYPVLMLWPFILITVGFAALLFSKKWRRFATGVLIVAAAMWIVVIGPCYGILLVPGMVA